mmetsp:Transcript_89989/g.279841  ORF Transcript_89989/g.279841 Transcript_89989/m.279841 type:complete len:246 (+) Transcript_89989:94-831(+)
MAKAACDPECDLSQASSSEETRASRAPSVVSEDSSDENSSEAADEGAELASVQELLEVMNAAAEELNAAQQELGARSAEREALLQRWAAECARVAKAAGPGRLAQVRRVREAGRACEARREAVEAASRRYLGAREAGAPRAALEQLEAAHLACLAECEAAQAELRRVQKRPSTLRAALRPSIPYFEMEERHLARQAGLEAAERAAERRLRRAKASYQGAMRGLEALSEHVHERRAAAAASTTGEA